MAICLLWHQRSHDQSQQHHFTELGCGDATNLLPLVFYNPASTFTGIDSSQAELDRARLGAECLGLENIGMGMGSNLDYYNSMGMGSPIKG